MKEKYYFSIAYHTPSSPSIPWHNHSSHHTPFTSHLHKPPSAPLYHLNPPSISSQSSRFLTTPHHTPPAEQDSPVPCRHFQYTNKASPPGRTVDAFVLSQGPRHRKYSPISTRRSKGLQPMEKLSGKPILVVADQEFASPKLAKCPENTYGVEAILRIQASMYTKCVTY